MSGRWMWVQEGWRVVPEVPTDEMLDAWDAAEIVGDDEKVYRAIIATAPEPPCQGQPSVAQPLIWRDGVWWTPLPPPPEVKP